jgi:predicted membrane channel-forming protein YqfA (hemolysin III family)
MRDGVPIVEDMAFLKFRVAPAVMYILLAFSVVIKPKTMSLAFMIIGGIIAVMGARSAGLELIIAGMIVYSVQTVRKINRKRIL